MHLMDPNDLRRHIAHKRDSERSLPASYAAHMLAALAAGAPADYPALLRGAQWPAPPPYVFHTAPRHARELIDAQGLRCGQPGAEGTDPWDGSTGVYASQPTGVYVSERDDTAGRWSRWAQWDVWQVSTAGLPWQPDELNPRCWVLVEDVEPERLTLVHTSAP